MDELDYSVETQIIHSGYDRKTCWVQTRGGVIPPDTAVVTAQKLRITGSDIFYGIHDLRSDDGGRTWTPPTPQPGLMRRANPDGTEDCPCDGLFLVYTRRGANNDHVFRHRAPLFMARVDPDRLCLIRSTERPVVPERGARLGNFGICTASPQESWVVVSEWMQTTGPNNFDCTVCERYGSDNALFVSRIKWSKPNRLAL